MEQFRFFVGKVRKAVLHPGRAFARVVSILRQCFSRGRIRLITYHFLRARDEAQRRPALGGQIADYLGVVLSFKVANEDRLAILNQTLRILDGSIGGRNLSLQVIDASEPAFARRASAAIQQTQFRHTILQRTIPLTEAYLQMLKSSVEEYTYIQLDDAITNGLSPEFFCAACTLLERYRDYLSVVSIELPASIHISDVERQILVAPYQVTEKSSGARYLFGVEPALPLLFKEKVGEFEFGIFENGFYGFYFHNMIVPTHDYARRLEWFMTHVSHKSVHTIELAAAERTVGPFWTHLAIPLSGPCMIDLDFAPTPDAVRTLNSKNRLSFDAFAKGYDVKSAPLVAR